MSKKLDELKKEIEEDLDKLDHSKDEWVCKNCGCGCGHY